jgi:hypothetical protein
MDYRHTPHPVYWGKCVSSTKKVRSRSLCAANAPTSRNRNTKMARRNCLLCCNGPCREQISEQFGRYLAASLRTECAKAAGQNSCLPNSPACDHIPLLIAPYRHMIVVQDWHAGGSRVANTLDRNGLYPIRQAASSGECSRLFPD